MNKSLATHIIADANMRIEELKADREKVLAIIAEQNEILAWADKKIADYQAEIDAASPAKKHKIRWANTDNLGQDTSVEVHAPQCAHLTKMERHPFADISKRVEEWTSAEAFAKDYNSDFYNEAGLEGCFDITFFPCSGMVSKKTSLTGYDS